MDLAQITNRKPILKRRNSMATLVQAIYDGAVVICLIFSLALLLDIHFGKHYLAGSLALIGAMAFSYDRVGVYRSHGNMTQKAFTLGKAWSLTFVIFLTLAFATKTTDIFSRRLIILLFFSGYIAQVGGHIAFRSLHLFSVVRQQKSRALIIGTGVLADYLYHRVNCNPWMQEQVIGTVAISPHHSDDSADHGSAVPCLGEIDDVMDLVRNNDVSIVYIAVPLDASPIIKPTYIQLLDLNVDIHWAPNIFAMSLVNHSVKELAGIPILTLSETPLIGSHLLLKNLEDRLLALVFLLAVSPIMLLTALAIKLDSPGPIFFRQPRTGWDGKEFAIWKFRSMVAHQATQGEVAQATRNDPRVTEIGRFIRATSIDELPQLFNVIVGQMSLVGPRPHAVEHNQDYSRQIKTYLSRHRIKPGITGLAQVRGYRGEIIELNQMEERVQCDLEYINNWSIWLDISIICRTLFSITGKNAY